MYATAPGASGFETRYRRLADAVAAIEASPRGGVLRLPPGAFLLDGDGPALLDFTRAPIIQGAGMGATALVIAASVPATTDVIRYAPAAGGQRSQGFAVRDLSIVAQSGAPARHAIAIDVAAAGRFAREIRIERCWIGQLGGRAIETVNPLPNADGIWRLSIAGNWIAGGVRLLGAGDSIAIRDNAIGGANCGVEADLVPGASLLLIEGNNITSAGGAVWVKAGNHVILKHNNIEQLAEFVGGSGNRACVDLDGKATARLALPEVISNHIGVLNGIVGDAVRVNRCDEPQIERNTFTLVAAASVGIRRTSAALGVVPRANRIIFGAGTLE